MTTSFQGITPSSRAACGGTRRVAAAAGSSAASETMPIAIQPAGQPAAPSRAISAGTTSPDTAMPLPTPVM